MEPKDQCATLEQSKRLKELGLKGSSIFYHVCTNEWGISVAGFFNDDLLNFPAWNVAELGELLPVESGMKFFNSYYNDHLGEWCCEFSGFKTEEEHEAHDWGNPPPKIHEEEGETEAEARAAMLIYLLENKLINPEPTQQS